VTHPAWRQEPAARLDDFIEKGAQHHPTVSRCA
jgi:hypothetical protein